MIAIYFSSFLLALDCAILNISMINNCTSHPHTTLIPHVIDSPIRHVDNQATKTTRITRFELRYTFKMSRRILTSALSVLLAIAGSLTMLESVHAAVDSSSPDLSMFKLRPAARNVISHRNTDKPIIDAAEGAKLLRESLFSNDFQLRCVAYAHLLKIIRIAQEPPFNGIRPVFRDTIDALAIVTDVDRMAYWNLFKHHQVGQLPRLISQAIERLEQIEDQDSQTRDTWLELIHCAKAYIPELKPFLEERKRAQTIEQLETFKAIPVPVNEAHWASEKRVDRLRHKFNNHDSHFTDEQDVGEARIKVELYDDYEAFKLRRLIENSASGGNNTQALDDRLELAAYERTLEQIRDYASKEPASVTKTKMLLDILSFRRDRLEAVVKELLNHVRQPLKLDIGSAYEYESVWTELEGMQSRLEDDTIRSAIADFLEEPRNQATLERMRRAIKQHDQLMDALHELSLLNGRKGRRATSMEELNAKYDQVNSILNSFDMAFDTTNELQTLAVEMQTQEHQFNVLNNFINQGSW